MFGEEIHVGVVYEELVSTLQKEIDKHLQYRDINFGAENESVIS